MRNVPDDWDCYWAICFDCGNKYHESEGGCDCRQEELEREADEIFERLRHPEMRIQGLTAESAVMPLEDDLGRSNKKGELEYRLYIEEHDGPDELVFCAESWVKVKQMLGLTEDPSEPAGES